MTHRRLLCVLVFLTLSASAQARTKIAVLELRVDSGLDAAIAKTLDEVLLNAFHESGALDVLGSSDIATMLTLEEQRVQLTGCADDSCLAEIGGALGVQLLASASVGAVGEQFILSVKVIDVNNARVVDRAGANVDRDETQLVEALTGLVRKVTATLAIEQADTAGESLTAGDGSRGAMEVLPWVGLGLTVAVGGVGGVLAGLASSDASSAQDEYQGSPDWRDLKDSAETKALTADVMFGVAGAAAVATVVLFVLGAVGDDEAPAASITAIPVRGGGVASLAVRFE